MLDGGGDLLLPPRIPPRIPPSRDCVDDLEEAVLVADAEFGLFKAAKNRATLGGGSESPLGGAGGELDR